MTSTPESALVERLRKCAKIVHLEPGRSPLEEEYLEAAAAIERLQARVAELGGGLDALRESDDKDYQKLWARLAELERERDEARDTIRKLNRRCQQAEAGIAENVERARRSDGSLGRSLANAAAAMYLRERDEALARLAEAERERDEAQEKVRALDVLEEWILSPNRTAPGASIYAYVRRYEVRVMDMNVDACASDTTLAAAIFAALERANTEDEK